MKQLLNCTYTLLPLQATRVDGSGMLRSECLRVEQSKRDGDLGNNKDVAFSIKNEIAMKHASDRFIMRGVGAYNLFILLWDKKGRRLSFYGSVLCIYGPNIKLWTTNHEIPTLEC